jgi:hypothetical protein
MLQAEQTETGGTPEPASAILLATGLAAFAWRKRVSKVARAAFRARTGMSALLACALAMGVCASAFGQPFRVLNDNQAVRTLNASRTAQLNPLFTGSPLPIFLYSVVGADGNTYQGEMVGRSPFANGKTTTTVSVVLIPLIVKTLNGGNTFISDPTTADAGCLGTPTTNTAIGLTQASAELNQPPSPFIINGVTVGGFNFADAHLRAEFWGLGQPALGNAFHLNLPHTTAATQTIDATGQSTFNAITAGYGGTHCGANTGLTNNRGALGILNINYLDPLLQGIITTLGLTHNELPLFVLYRAVISDGNAGDPAHTCCILGYHGATNYTATGDPGQTYGIFEFDTGDAFPGVANTSVMAHEVSEWVNDPGGSDPTPVWSSGQSALCTTAPPNGPGQNNLEVGDPLSGISNDHFITMSNGFNYRMQELVYFSWFYSADHTLPPMGASATCLTTAGNSGCLSTNGTFKGPARYCSASPVNTGGTYPN